MFLALLLLSAFFAVNMGGSTFAASFAASYGGKALNKRNCQILFTIFVIIGAVLIGKPVAKTLGEGIIPKQFLDSPAAMIILISAALGLFVSNIFQVPQSTSFVTVFSIMGVGAYHHHLNKEIFLIMIPMWIFLPVVAYLLTYFLGKLFYPPRGKNLWIYEKLINQRKRLRFFVNLTSCYNAFSVGANNVANAVGPLLGAGVLSSGSGLFFLAPFFGVGSFVFHKGIEETGEKIIPIGLFTASLMAIVSGTLMLFASILGIPQSFVMIKMTCIFAIGSLKSSPEETFQNPITKKTYWMWAITPVVTFFISLGLTWVRFNVF